MDEGVFDAEADLDRQTSHDAPNTRQDGTERGENAALLASGGVDPTLASESADEETPLLSREGDVSPRSSETAIDDGPENASEWPGQADFDHLPWWKRPAIFWMLGPFLLFTLAFGGTMIPKINLIQDLLCREYYMKKAIIDPTCAYVPIAFGQSDERCTVPDVEAAAAEFTMASNLIAGILSSITSPKLGALSDRYGRLRILILTTAGLLVSEILTIVAATNPETVSPYWILLGYALDGLGGSFIAGMAISHSYAADCTPPARRNVAFGYFHGVLFTGVALGPILAAQVIKLTGSIVSIFWLALGCHIFFVTCLGLVIPESLSKRRQLAAREKYANKAKQVSADIDQGGSSYGLKTIMQSIKAFFEPLKILYPTGPGSSPALRRNLALIASIDTIVFGVAMGSMSIVAIYIRKQFHWDTTQQATFVSIVNIVRVLCLFLLLPAITRLVRGKHTPTPSSTSPSKSATAITSSTPTPSSKPQHQTGADTLDLVLLRTAIVFDTIGYLGYTLSRTAGTFTASGIVTAVGGIASPTLSSSLTKHVPADRTGALLGASGLLHGLARVVAPLVFNSIFAATAGGFRQTVFVCLTACFAGAFAISWGIRPGVYLGDEGRGEDGMRRDEDTNGEGDGVVR